MLGLHLEAVTITLGAQDSRCTAALSMDCLLPALMGSAKSNSSLPSGKTPTSYMSAHYSSNSCTCVSNGITSPRMIWAFSGTLGNS